MFLKSIKFIYLFAGIVSMIAAPLSFASVNPEMDKTRLLDIQKLSRDNVQVIRLGQTVRIVLLNGNLFYPNASNLWPYSQKTLKTVADFINTYNTTSIKVSVYSDDAGPNKKRREKALTAAQAKTIVNFLSSQGGLDARILYGVGYGPVNAVDDNHTHKGRWNNRRTEISFNYSV